MFQADDGHRPDRKKPLPERPIPAILSGDMTARKPEWLKKDLRSSPALRTMIAALDGQQLETVCEEARCPNRLECFSGGRVAFLILGRVCTRACSFCGVTRGRPAPPDPAEPERVAASAAGLAMRHVVVTSVTRDDLPDGGAGHFRRVVEALRRLPGGVSIEILVPDFQGDPAALNEIALAEADIVNHNVETVPRLYPHVRPQASYDRSLFVLESIKSHAADVITKSGLMVGMGETGGEITRVLRDLRQAGCDMVTIGQYLPPARSFPPAAAYVTPAAFAGLRREALSLGFRAAACGPFVRSSYGAEEMFTSWRNPPGGVHDA
jgi:lipoyl synthase